MMNLTPNQSHYVLSTLVSRHEVRPSQVTQALKARDQEIKQLRERLASLERLGKESSARGRAPRRRRAAGKTRVRRRALMSPRVHALRRLQGKYMGYVRRLKAGEKARVRSVREKQGIESAIRLAASLASKL